MKIQLLSNHPDADGIVEKVNHSLNGPSKNEVFAFKF